MKLEEQLDIAKNFGRETAYLDIINLCFERVSIEYDNQDPALRMIELEKDRAAAIAALRDLCAEVGDNDWPDNLRLEDIINKHLRPYLAE